MRAPHNFGESTSMQGLWIGAVGSGVRGEEGKTERGKDGKEKEREG